MRCTRPPVNWLFVILAQPNTPCLMKATEVTLCGGVFA